MQSEKEKIRAEHKRIRQEMTVQEAAAKSEQICQMLEKNADKIRNERFYAYYPLKKEVSLLPFFEILLQQGKQLAFPRVRGDEMDFYEVHSMQDFEMGSFHIMEPVGKQPVNWEDAVVFVPGTVFDRRGNRMGYGKGYYDRYLSEHADCRPVGVCYEHQMEEQLQGMPWDVVMQAIVTERKFTIIKA